MTPITITITLGIAAICAVAWMAFKASAWVEVELAHFCEDER